MDDEIHAAQPPKREINSASSMEKSHGVDFSTEPEYPAMRRIIPIIAMLYVTIFLVAIVCQLSTSCFFIMPSNLIAGSYNPSNGHSPDIRRVPLPRRHILVCLRVSTNGLLVPIVHG